MIKVNQDSEPGSLGLDALFNNGFVGPPCDLSDCLVHFYDYNKSISVNLYDMTCLVNESNPYYKKMRSQLDNLKKA